SPDSQRVQRQHGGRRGCQIGGRDGGISQDGRDGCNEEGGNQPGELPRHAPSPQVGDDDEKNQERQIAEARQSQGTLVFAAAVQNLAPLVVDVGFVVRPCAIEVWAGGNCQARKRPVRQLVVVAALIQKLHARGEMGGLVIGLIEYR